MAAPSYPPQPMPPQPMGPPPQPMQPPPQQPPYIQPVPPGAYYPHHAGPKIGLGILVPIGLILAAVGLMIVGGANFAATGSTDFKTVYNMMGGGWLLAGIGVILIAVAELVKTFMKK